MGSSMLSQCWMSASRPTSHSKVSCRNRFVYFVVRPDAFLTRSPDDHRDRLGAHWHEEATQLTTDIVLLKGFQPSACMIQSLAEMHDDRMQDLLARLVAAVTLWQVMHCSPATSRARSPPRETGACCASGGVANRRDADTALARTICKLAQVSLSMICRATMRFLSETSFGCLDT